MDASISTVMRMMIASELFKLGPNLNPKPYPQLNSNKLRIFLVLGSVNFANNAKTLIGQKIWVCRITGGYSSEYGW